ncbi:MAG: VWA domain-containing protein [Candidatus Acidiferrales bacterium]
MAWRSTSANSVASQAAWQPLLVWTLAVGSLLIAGAVVLRGQSRSVQDPGIRVDVDLVLVPLSVTDPRGRLVTGLDRGHFRVFEDGVEQEIQSLHMEDASISVAIVFDISGSMKPIVQRAREAALEFVRTANRDDSFMMIAFKDRAEVITDANTTEDELRDRLLYTNASGRTAMIDGIYLALAKLRDAPTRRRTLLVITDGQDNHSRYNERDLERAIREADVSIYGIGYDGLGILSKFAQSTGGRIFPLGEVKNTASAIWAELRNQYVIGYRSSNHTRDGQWRKIKIKLRPPRGLPPLEVYAKAGYYARMR